MTEHTTTTAPTGHEQVPGTAIRPALWRAGLSSGATAALATTAAAAAAREAGVALSIDDERIPLLGFTQLTLVGAILGVALAWALRRRATHPRRTFVRTTVVLTALSIVPDVLVDASTATKVVLAATHVLAAAAVVPTLARRLPG